MSEITGNENLEQSATEKSELTLEQKIENHSIENKGSVNESEDLSKLLKKKNEILDEKKKIQLSNKKLQEELEAMKGAFARQEQEKLEEKQEYKKLWENTQEELKKERLDRHSLELNIVKNQKRKAFDKELGKSLSKERYYDFVNYEDIIVEQDGTVNSESVRYSVNLFRENYNELVPVSNIPRVGSEAPSNSVITTKKQINELNNNDRNNLKRRLLSKSS